MPDGNAKAAPDWQAIAARLIAEHDPEKVLAHSKELIRALDEDSRRRLESKKSEAGLPKEMVHKWEGGAGSTTGANAPTRCPYCTEDGKFRAMVSDADGRMVCDSCGHLACPSNPDYSCNCRNCGQLAVFTRNHSAPHLGFRMEKKAPR